MSIFRAVTLFVLVAVTVGCSDDGGLRGDADVVESSAIWEPGESWKPPSKFLSHPDYWAATQYARAAGVIMYPLAGGGWNWCSAALIGSYKVVTADHCVEHLDLGTGVGFTPAFYDGLNIPLFTPVSDLKVTEIGMIAFGLRGSALSNAIQDARAHTMSRGTWTCYYAGQDGTRDVAYLTCDGLPLLDQNNRINVIGPGDVYGFLDVKIESPGNDIPVYTLSVNALANSPAQKHLLLSPNGKVQNRGSTTCANLPWTSYTNCTAVQGMDILPGSSGGAVFTRDDNRVFAIVNGTSSTSRNPVCAGNKNPCLKNLEKVSRMSAQAFEDANIDPLTSLSSPPSVSTSSRHASSTGIQFNARCADDEAMIGLIGGWSSPFLSGERQLSSLGSVCAPVFSNFGVLYQGDTYVQSGGASNVTDGGTGVYSSGERILLNRYRNTVSTTTWVAFLPVRMPQTVALCSGGTAIYRVDAFVESGVVRGIKAVGCRDDSGASYMLDIPNTGLGSGTSASSVVSRSCSGKRVAIGHFQWIESTVEDIQLICREW